MSAQYASNASGSGKSKVLAKNPDDVVIVSAVRSAVTKVCTSLSLLHPSAHPWLCQAKKGGFKDTRPEEILSGVLRAAYTKAGLDPALIEDITVGNVLPPGSGASAARMAELHAGIPITTPISTVNRQCSSGLAATNNIAALITSGQIDIGLGK